MKTYIILWNGCIQCVWHTGRFFIIICVLSWVGVEKCLSTIKFQLLTHSPFLWSRPSDLVKQKRPYKMKQRNILNLLVSMICHFCLIQDSYFPNFSFLKSHFQLCTIKNLEVEQISVKHLLTKILKLIMTTKFAITT